MFVGRAMTPRNSRLPRKGVVTDASCRHVAPIGSTRHNQRQVADLHASPAPTTLSSAPCTLLSTTLPSPPAEANIGRPGCQAATYATLSCASLRETLPVRRSTTLTVPSLF